MIAEGLDAHSLIPLVAAIDQSPSSALAPKRQNLFTPEDVDFLSRASGQIAIAIENALVFQEVSGVGARLQLLLNLTSRITSSLDLREVLRAIAANIREVTHGDAVVVSLPDPTSVKFKVFAMDFPHGKGAIKEELVLPLSPEAKKAMDTLKPMVFDPRARDEHASEPYDVAAAEGVKGVCSIPLVDRGRALGILSILRTTESPFTPEDADFLGRA